MSATFLKIPLGSSSRDPLEDPLRVRDLSNTSSKGNPKLGRALGHFIFSLIGLKRILFTNIFQTKPHLVKIPLEESRQTPLREILSPAKAALIEQEAGGPVGGHLSMM